VAFAHPPHGREGTAPEGMAQPRPRRRGDRV